MGPLVTLEMPVGYLGTPAADGAAELVDLGWAGFVLEVVTEMEGISEGNRGAVDSVDVSYGFGGVPGGAYYAVGVAGVEEGHGECRARGR